MNDLLSLIKKDFTSLIEKLFNDDVIKNNISNKLTIDYNSKSKQGDLSSNVLFILKGQILNKSFKGQGVLRGLFLFPYVAPIIAVAFTWVILLDPFSGSINTLLVQMDVAEKPINFFGRKPLALIMVTVFEIWRYFPLSFLFIPGKAAAISKKRPDIDNNIFLIKLIILFLIFKV